MQVNSLVTQQSERAQALGLAEANILQISKNCESLRSENQQKDEIIGNLRNEKENLGERIRTVETDSSDTMKRFSVAVQENENINQTLLETTENLEDWKRKYEQLEKDTLKVFNEMTEKTEKAQLFESKLDSSEKEKESLNAALSFKDEAAKTREEKQEEQWNTLMTEAEHLEQQLNRTKGELKESEQIRKEMQSEIITVRGQLQLEENKKEGTQQNIKLLENTIKERLEEVDQLQKSLRTLKDELVSKQKKIESLEEGFEREKQKEKASKRIHKSEIEKLNSEVQKARNDREQVQGLLEQTLESLHTQRQELKNTNGNMKEQLTAHKTVTALNEMSIRNLQKDKEAFSFRIQKLTEQLETKTLENDKLANRVYTAKRKLSVLENSLEESTHEKEIFAMEIEANCKELLDDSLESSFEEDADDRRSPMTSTPLKDSSSLRDSGLGASGELEEYETVDAPTRETNYPSKNKRFRKVLSLNKNALSYLKDSNLELQHKCNRLETDLEHEQKQNTEIENQLVEEISKNAELKRRLQDAIKLASSLEMETKGLVLNMEKNEMETKEKILTQNYLINKKERENRMMKNDILLLQEDLGDSQNKLEKKEELFNNVKKELLLCANQLAKLREEMEIRDEKIRSLQEDVLNLRRKNAAIENENKLMEREKEEKEDEMNDIQRKFETMRKVNEALEKKKEMIEVELIVAKEQIVTLEERCNALQRYRDKISEELDASKMKVDSLNVEVTEKQNQLNKGMLDIKETEFVNKNMAKDKQLFDRKLKESKCKIESLEASLAKSEQDKNYLKREIFPIKKELEELQENFQNMKTGKAEMVRQLDDSVISLETSAYEIEKLGDKNDQLKKELQKHKTTTCVDVVQQKSEILRLKCELESLRQVLGKDEYEKNYKSQEQKLMKDEIGLLHRKLEGAYTQKAEMEMELISTRGKLQNYVKERDNWETEIARITAEVERERCFKESKDYEMKAIREKYQEEIDSQMQRLVELEHKLRLARESSEKQRQNEQVNFRMALEAKRMEFKTMKEQFQIKGNEDKDKYRQLQLMMLRVEERDREIDTLKKEYHKVRDSYEMELKSIKADLQCAHMEHKLTKTKQVGYLEKGNPDYHRKLQELIDAVTASRHEAEQLRGSLNSRMDEMRSLKRDVLMHRTDTIWLNSSMYNY